MISFVCFFHLQQQFYLCTEQLENYQGQHELEIISTCTGQDLAGREYTPLFPDFAEQREQGAFQVVCGDFVTTDIGTGIVHCAPAFGEDDAAALKAANISAFACPIDDHGCFTDEVQTLAGQTISDANKTIIKQLKNEQALYQHDTIVHSYPFCPRSDTPLIYKAIPSWYVQVEAIKDKLIANNKAIHWVPEHIQQGRFGKWLANAKDWAISRNRVWGTPLPIWINDETGAQHCIGDIAELETLCNTKITDLHREYVDELTFTKANEPGTYRRIPEVLDCWFESGAMPYAQLHYPFENKEIFTKGFPAEFIAEGLDQTRGWFYTLNVLATALFNKPAFTHVIVNGIIMAEDGKKMSKRLQNYTDPDALMTEHGADALRLYLINSGLVKGEEQRFSDDGVKDMVRRTLLPWYHAFTFFKTYAEVDQWRPDQHHQTSNTLLDQWILSRLESTKQGIEEHMQAYRLYWVVPELLRFIDDLTNGYIRLNRQRFWTDTLDDDKCNAFSTLYQVLHELTLIMAPFTPFLSETIYQGLQAFSSTTHSAESVHLCDYPKTKPEHINPNLEQAVDQMQQIILLGRQQRNDVKIKVKTPLASLRIIHKDKKQLKQIKLLEAIIARELNVKKIIYDHHEAKYIKLYAQPNSPVLGKRFGAEFKSIRQHIQNLSADELEGLETIGSITIAQETFSRDDILIFRESKFPGKVLSNRFITIELNTDLTPELVQEGLAREVVNRIQKTRKDIGLHVADRVHIHYHASADLQQAITEHEPYIAKETLALSLVEQDHAPQEGSTHTIDEYSLTLVIDKAEV